MKDWTEQVFGVPYAGIVALVLLNAGVFAADGADRSLTRDFGAVPTKIVAAWDSVQHGQIGFETLTAFSTLFSALFLHEGVEHLGYNMVFLWAFGGLCSRLLGQWQVVVLYLLFGACGNGLQVFLEPESNFAIIGASGAVMGFEGLYLGLALRWQLEWADIWPIARPIPPLQLAAIGVVGFAFDAYSLVNSHEMVAFGAHLGGFLTGLGVAAVLTQAYPTVGRYRGY